MSSRETVVACCQLPLTVGDVAANRAAVEAAVERVASAGADIIVLPELAASGYRIESRDELETLGEPLNGATLKHWGALAARHDVVIVGGFVERGAAGRFHNSAAIVDRTGVRASYRKVHLWDREAEWFAPGDQQPPVVKTHLGSLGLMICYDLEFPEWSRTAALRGAQLLCVPVNWPLFDRPSGERPAEIVRVQAAASSNRMYIAACDRTAFERGTDWLGGSVIVDADGFPRTPIRLDVATDIVAHIDLDQALDKSVGPRNNVHADRRPRLYGTVAADPAAPEDLP